MRSVEDLSADVALLAAARCADPRGTDAEETVAAALAGFDAVQKRQAFLAVAQAQTFVRAVIERAGELADGGEVTEEHVRCAAALVKQGL